MSFDRARLVLRWSVRVWSGSLPLLGAILALTAVSAALITALPWLWQFLIDALHDDTAPADLQELGLWMVAVGLGHAVAYLALQCARAWMNCRIEQRARDRVFAHLVSLGPDFWPRWRTGDLVTRLTDDAGEKLSWFLCSGIFRALEALAVIVACLGAMAWIDPVVTAWTVLPLPLLIGAQAGLQGVLGQRFARVQRAISAINDELETTFGGIRVVQACGLGPAARSRFGTAARTQRDAEVAVTAAQQLVFAMYGYGWQLTLVALLLAGGPRVIDGSLTLGQFVTLEGLVMTLVWPMFDLGMFVSRYAQAGVALTRLEQLLAASPPATLPAEHPEHPGLEATGIVVRVGEATLLDGVDLRVDPGETVAVVGEVGSGKSQLLAALAGSRAFDAGRVALGGARLDAVPAAERAARLALAPQDPLLLSATVRENITLGRAVSDDALDRAVRLSRLATDLPALPDGLDTAVGERGVTLSGGQQQRVSLARALVGDPDVVLLDDATAALDARTEAELWDGLLSGERALGAVVVTHRVGTLKRADRIVVLEGGRVVDAGSHAELIARDGPYRRLYGRFVAEDRVASAAREVR